MYTAARISREEFLNSHFLKVTVLEMEKNYLHHNRFVLEVITDRSKEQAKKKFSEILRFSEQVCQRMGLKDLLIETHMRASKKLEQVEMLFKKLNTVYLAVGVVGTADPQANAVRVQIRNYLYNLLFTSIEQMPSSEDEDESKNSYIGSNASPFKEKAERKEEKLEWERSEKVDKIERPEKGERNDRDKLQGKQGKEAKESRETKQSKQSTKFPNVIRNIFKPKRDSQDLRRRQLLKGIKSIWIREEKGWSERLFSINDESLILIQRAEPQQKQIIFLKYLQAKFKQDDYYRILLAHPLLSKEIQIRVHSFEGLVLDQREQYVNFLTALKEVCEKGQREAHNFVGVYLSNKKNKFMVEPQKRPAQRLMVRLSHEQDTYSFTMAIDSGVFLQLPIVSNYGKFQAEITEQREGSLLPTLSSEKSISFPLPVQGMYDQLYNDRPKRKTPQMRSHLLQSKQCNYSIRLQYFSMTAWQAYCSGQLNDRFEGVDQPNEFSRGEFRIQKNRIKRILYSIEEWMAYIGGLVNFEYPSRSAIFYVLLLIAVIEFNANHVLQYSLAAACILLAYLHPASGVYCRDLISYAWSSQWVKALQNALQEKRWRASFKVSLKKVQEKRKFLQDFNMRKKKKRNILQKYNRLQQVLLKGQLALTQVVTLCEKAKNLFCWYHHRKTQWLFLILLALFVILFFLPLRAMAVIALAITCQKGWNSHAKIYQRNQFVLLAVLRIIVQEEGLTTLRDNLADVNRPFDKRTGQYATFQKKVKEGLGEILGLQFDVAIFQYGKTVGEMIGWLAQCRERLTIPEDICRKHHFNLEWSRSGGRLASFLTAIYLLLISVPSDRNILDVKHEPEQQEDSDDDELP